MNWTSQQDIVTSFNLQVEGDSVDDTIRAVRRKMKEIHPDNNTSKFADSASEEQWHELTSAKDYLESIADQKALVPVSQLPALFKAMAAMNAEPLTVRSSRIIEESSRAARKRHLFPKITSGMAAVVCGYLFTSYNSLIDHPLLGKLFSTEAGQLFLLGAFLTSAFIFICTWWKEGMSEQKLEWILSTEGTRQILFRVIRQFDHQSNTEGIVFTMADLLSILVGSGMMRSSSLSRMTGRNFGSAIDPQTAEKTARLMIDRLEEEKVLEELPRRGLQQKYLISADIVRELKSLN